MQERVEQVRRTLPLWLLGTFIAVIISGALWFQFVYKDPRNVFEAMLSGTMGVAGYTKQTVTDQGEAGKTTELRRMQFGAQPVSETVVTQHTETTTVKTETVSMLTKQYVRFADIQTSQQTPNGGEIDFSDVLGKWGEGQIAPTPVSGPFVGDVLTGSDQYTLVVPMADVPADKRQALLKNLVDNHVFVPDYNGVKTEQVNGRDAYAYPVQLQMQAYVGYLKHFGEALGMAEYVSSLDPSQYEGVEPVNVTMYVDPLSHKLVRFDYDAGIARQDTFSGYGLVRVVPVPQDALPIAELQARISGAVSGE
jgi:hypothetical protein